MGKIKDDRSPRITVPTLEVLGAILSVSGAEVAGVDIATSAGLSSGTLYPILLRLEEAGWLESQWESTAPQVLGRPRRRLYQLTGLGAKETRRAFRELKVTLSNTEMKWA